MAAMAGLGCRRSHDPISVEPYLGRCFPGIKRLLTSCEGGVRINALVSPEGEVLPLRVPVDLVVGGRVCVCVV
jgi:hypothetical protein